MAMPMWPRHKRPGAPPVVVLVVPLVSMATTAAWIATDTTPWGTAMAVARVLAALFA